MKLKKQYKFLLIAIALLLATASFSIYYIGYGWGDNPWADERLVWDAPTPQLIGKKFSITGRAAYKNEIRSLPSPVKKLGVISYINADPGNEQLCIPNDKSPKPDKDGNFVVSCDNTKIIAPILIEPTEVFTIEKTYWIRHNFWSVSFHSDYRVAIITNKNGAKFVLDFLDFHVTNESELEKFGDEIRNIKWSYWNLFNTEIAYVKN